MKQPLVVIAGPTASGKSKLSVSVAKVIGGEAISADSMQVYKYMDIGSAKITSEEMEGVPHYLVDELYPDEDFNVNIFQTMAKKAMEQIYSHGHVPILVGGTGFYIQSVTKDIDFEETEVDQSIRQRFEEIVEKNGNAYLHDLLAHVDPASGEAIHPNNVKRVIRALEYYKQTGTPISEHNRLEGEKESPYNVAFYVLNMDRALLYERIDYRVDLMIEQGLVAEVEKIKNLGYDRSLIAMQGLGYKEIYDHLLGLCTLEEAIYTIKRDTRHFAKRQITWFKREKQAKWINVDDFNFDINAITEYVIDDLKKQNIF